MKKISSSFVCQECGYDSPQWLGKCPECGAWNSLKEFHVSSKFKVQSSKSRERKNEDIKPKTLSEIQYEEKNRILTGFSEMDGVLGGGIVGGSVVLLAGDPGIGKSTLILQTALNVAGLYGAGPAARQPQNFPTALTSAGPHSGAPRLASPAGGSVLRYGKTQNNAEAHPSKKVLYVSGEESGEQIKLRAQRIDSGKNENLLLLSVTDTDAIIEVIEQIRPSLVIVDSIQTIESGGLEGLAGSVGQVRYAAFQFVKLAKSLNIPVIIIGHVTKEGMVAGPMILSHMVDVVLFLEGEKTTGTRILRSFKNRFGPVDEVGIFTMEGTGMSEVKNPEQIFLSLGQNQSQRAITPGSSLVVTLEGTRAFLVELQALVVYSKLPMPRRVASGIDHKRLELLLAVLQKHCRLPFETSDVFVNVAGGIRLSDPAVDLGICLALFSSLKNIPITKTVGVAEVGLLGELRPVPFLEKRVKEAKKLGFKDIITTNTHKSLNDVLKSL